MSIGFSYFALAALRCDGAAASSFEIQSFEVLRVQSFRVFLFQTCRVFRPKHSSLSQLKLRP